MACVRVARAAATLLIVAAAAGCGATDGSDRASDTGTTTTLGTSTSSLALAATAGASGPAGALTRGPVYCTPKELAYGVVTDRPTYQPGTSVTFTLTQRNVSDQACEVNGSRCGQAAHVLSHDGNVVWVSNSTIGEAGDPDQCKPFSSPSLQPGETYTAHATWDQRVVAGSYTVDGYWYNQAYISTVKYASASFEVG